MWQAKQIPINQILIATMPPLSNKYNALFLFPDFSIPFKFVHLSPGLHELIF